MCAAVSVMVCFMVGADGGKWSCVLHLALWCVSWWGQTEGNGNVCCS